MKVIALNQYIYSQDYFSKDNAVVVVGVVIYNC